MDMIVFMLSFCMINGLSCCIVCCLLFVLSRSSDSVSVLCDETASWQLEGWALDKSLKSLLVRDFASYILRPARLEKNVLISQLLVLGSRLWRSLDSERTQHTEQTGTMLSTCNIRLHTNTRKIWCSIQRFLTHVLFFLISRAKPSPNPNYSHHVAYFKYRLVR